MTHEWRRRYGILSCGCRFVPPERANPGDEWPCEICGPGWIKRILEVSEK